MWALSALDATGKPGSSVLWGNLRSLGDWDQCVAVPNGRTRMCVADVRLPEPSSVAEQDRRIIYKATTGRWAKEDLANRTGPVVLPVFTLVQWAVCVPSSCGPDDVSEAVSSFLSAVVGTQLTAVVPPNACSGPHPPFTTSNIVVLSLIGCIIVAILVCSIWEYLTYKDPVEGDSKKALSTGTELLRGISFRHNWDKLWRDEVGRGAVSCLDGVRALSALWVVMTHKVLQMSQEPWVNKVLLYESARDVPKMPLLNSMLNVDSFLVLSGLLRSLNFLRDADRGHPNFLCSILQRYLRLTPAYAVVLGIYTSLLVRLGSGPLWDSQVAAGVRMCQLHWPLNLLYVNNYLRFEDTCMVQSWYLSADLQLFVGSLLLLVPLIYWRHAGPLLLGVATLLSAALPFTVILVRRLPGLYQPHQPDHQLFEYMRDVYVQTHNRMSPYVIGLALGYLLHRTDGRNVSLGKVWTGAGWALSLFVLAAVVWGPYYMLQDGAMTLAIEAAMYGGLHRLAWAAALSWIIFACHHHLDFGFIGLLVRKVLDSSFLKPISRLSYCIFLTHVAVLIVNSGRIRTPIYMDEFLLLYSYAGDIGITFPIAMALHLLVEAPSVAIARALFGRRHKVKTAESVGDRGIHLNVRQKWAIWSRQANGL